VHTENRNPLKWHVSWRNAELTLQQVVQRHYCCPLVADRHQQLGLYFISPHVNSIIVFRCSYPVVPVNEHESFEEPESNGFCSIDAWYIWISSAIYYLPFTQSPRATPNNSLVWRLYDGVGR